MTADVLLSNGKVVRIKQALETPTGIVLVDTVNRRWPVRMAIRYTAK